MSFVKYRIQYSTIGLMMGCLPSVVDIAEFGWRSFHTH
jgi:hypothetical protein